MNSELIMLSELLSFIAIFALFLSPLFLLIMNFYFFRKNYPTSLIICVALIYVFTDALFLYQNRLARFIGLSLDQQVGKKGLEMISNCQHKYYSENKRYESNLGLLVDDCFLLESEKDSFRNTYQVRYHYACSEDFQYNLELKDNAVPPIVLAIKPGASLDGFTCIAYGQLYHHHNYDYWLTNGNNKIYHLIDSVTGDQSHDLLNGKVVMRDNYHEGFIFKKRFIIDFIILVVLFGGAVSCAIAAFLIRKNFRKSNAG